MQPTNGQSKTEQPTFRPLDQQPDHDRPTARRRVTVAEAAVLLGLTEDAVRSRLKRGTLRKEKAADGTVLVVLGEGGSTDRPTTNEGQPTTSQPTDQPTDEATDQDLVEALRERIEHLSRIIDTRDEEIRRRDTIIMSLTQRIPELEGPADHPGDERDGAETASPRSDRGAGKEAVECRSWWKRFFGLE